MKKSIFLAIFFMMVAIPVGSVELRLIRPNGGEQVCLSRPFRITWTATGVTARVKLQLIRSGGGLVGLIAANLDAAAQGYDWASAGGAAPAGSNYKVRVVAMDGSLADESDAAFALKACSGGVHAGDLQVSQPPDLQVSRAQTPQFEIARAPKLQVSDLQYNYAAKRLEAWVRNNGNAPFVGHFGWKWNTDCGVREANKDIPPDQSALLENGPGLYFSFPCAPDLGACSVRASFAIDPFALDGRHYEPSSMQKDIPSFAGSQFLMSNERILLRFLHGSRWVDCAHGYVITSEDAFDYDPGTQTATFLIGFPIKNCGSQAGRSDHDPSQKLYWSVFHSPSNTCEIYANSVSNGGNYSQTPLEPGQGILLERSVSLKVRSGIYMLHVHGGSDPAGSEHCVISIRFADNLIH